MNSLFDSTIAINETNGTVTIVYKGNHSALIIETMHPDTKEREIRYAHFLPEDITTCPYDFKNIVASLHDYTSSDRAGRVDMKDCHAIDTKNQLLQHLKLDCASKTYSSTRVKIEILVNEIRGQRDKTISVPRFHIRGISVGQNVFNCRSWVRQKLSIINVTIPVSFIDETSSDTLGCDKSDKNCNIL